MAVVTTFHFESSTQPEWPHAYYALKIMHLINHHGVVASGREKGCLVAASPQPRDAARDGDQHHQFSRDGPFGPSEECVLGWFVLHVANHPSSSVNVPMTSLFS